MIFAVMSGTLIGYLIVSARLTQILLVFYHVPYKLSGKYYIFYEVLENSLTYEVIGRRQFKSQIKFLKHYDKYKPNINEHFNMVWNHHAFGLLKVYGLVMIISVVLFWYDYLFFIIPYIFIQLVYSFYSILFKGNGETTYIYLMLETILNKSDSLQNKNTP